MGLGGFLGSLIQVVAGLVLLAIGNPYGLALIASGVLSAAATALAPDVTEASDERSSPTYGFSQFVNPVKGDSPPPIVYSTLGHKMAPVWLQAFVTPRGTLDTDYNRVLRAEGQGLSGLLAVGEGPVQEIYDLRFNDEPVLTKSEGVEVGRGNGTKTKFELGARGIEVFSVRVYVDGVLKGWAPVAKSTLVGTGDGRTQVFTFKLPERAALDLDLKFYNTNPEGRTAADKAAFELTGENVAPSEVIVPRAWPVSPYKIAVSASVPFPTNMKIYAEWQEWITDAVDIEQDGDGVTTLKFKTAPASGQVVTVDYVKKNFNCKVFTRLGTRNQMPIFGFGDVRNTIGKGAELPKGDWSQCDMTSEADDVIVDISTSPNGFASFDDEGDMGPQWATVAIEVKLLNPSATGLNVFSTFQRIPDPRGSWENKAKDEFIIYGESLSQLFFSFSVRNLLEANFLQNPKDGNAERMLSHFQRGKYAVRVKRTNTVRENSSTKHIDGIYFTSIQEVTHEALSYPGVALIGFHALASSKLNGSAPNVTCRVKGIRTVPYWTGTEWKRDLWSKQGNRVWALCDLITSRRYGAGEHFTLSDIDTTSAKIVADWLDESVSDGTAFGTETRSLLDYVLDIRRPLRDVVKDIAGPGRVFVVLQGRKWRFVKDDAVDLDDAHLIYDDTSAARTAKNTLVLTHDTVAARPTELQLLFLSKDDDFQQKELWIPPPAGNTEERRIERVSAHGIVRRSEASRLARFTYEQMRQTKTFVTLGVSPQGLHYEAGDVSRLVSNRFGLDEFFRIRKIEFSSKDFFLRVDAALYVPAVYGQAYDKMTLLEPSKPRGNERSATVVSGPSPARAATRKMALRTRRVA